MDIDIEYVAKLARIDLGSQQKKKLTRQLSDILSYVEKLKELDISSVEAMSHVLSLQNVFRQDKAGPSLSVDKALGNAPSKEGNSFSVPKIIE